MNPKEVNATMLHRSSCKVCQSDVLEPLVWPVPRVTGDYIQVLVRLKRDIVRVIERGDTDVCSLEYR